MAARSGIQNPGTQDAASYPPAEMLAFARQVITTEASGLIELARVLDDRFAKAVDVLLGLRGRVVVTGMGKSGYVARKVTATLASTGTPAIFVHPAEAAHGDLGMLMRGDALLAFSNSGDTAELQAILQHAAKLALPLIAVSARADSLLMRTADVGLLLPAVEEACPANLAPTTSTAMMMALGDALALAAMQVRGVSRDSFQELHPGGAIGKRLMRVAAVMHVGATMPVVGRTTRMREVIMTITGGSFGIAGVVDEAGVLVGVITDGDVRRHIDALDALAGDVMTVQPVCTTPGCLIEDALAMLNERKITAMFALDEGGRPLGIVHVHDFLRLGLA